MDKLSSRVTKPTFVRPQYQVGFCINFSSTMKRDVEKIMPTILARSASLVTYIWMGYIELAKPLLPAIQER